MSHNGGMVRRLVFSVFVVLAVWVGVLCIGRCVGGKLNWKAISNAMLTWSPIFASVAGGLWALFEWHRSNNEKRAEFLDAMLKRFYEDEIRDFFYRCIDSESQDWYDRGKENVAFMKQVDSAFSFFSYLCYLRMKGLIEKKEFDFFSYQIDRLLNNQQTWHYLLSLIEIEKEQKLKNPFSALMEYGHSSGFNAEIFARYEVNGLPDSVFKDLREKFSCNSIDGQLPRSWGRKQGERNSEYIKRVVFPLIENECLVKEEIEAFTGEEESRRVFSLSYPFLVRMDELDPTMRRHYYVAPVRYQDSSYLICNEWKKRQKDKLYAWVKKIFEKNDVRWKPGLQRKSDSKTLSCSENPSGQEPDRRI